MCECVCKALFPSVRPRAATRAASRLQRAPRTVHGPPSASQSAHKCVGAALPAATRRDEVSPTRRARRELPLPVHRREGAARHGAARARAGQPGCSCLGLLRRRLTLHARGGLRASASPASRFTSRAARSTVSSPTSCARPLPSQLHEHSRLRAPHPTATARLRARRRCQGGDFTAGALRLTPRQSKRAAAVGTAAASWTRPPPTRPHARSRPLRALRAPQATARAVSPSTAPSSRARRPPQPNYRTPQPRQQPNPLPLLLLPVADACRGARRPRRRRRELHAEAHRPRHPVDGECRPQHQRCALEAAVPAAPSLSPVDVCILLSTWSQAAPPIIAAARSAPRLRPQAASSSCAPSRRHVSAARSRAALSAPASEDAAPPRCARQAWLDGKHCVFGAVTKGAPLASTAAAPRCCALTLRAGGRRRHGGGQGRRGGGQPGALPRQRSHAPRHCSALAMCCRLTPSRPRTSACSQSGKTAKARALCDARPVSPLRQELLLDCGPLL